MYEFKKKKKNTSGIAIMNNHGILWLITLQVEDVLLFLKWNTEYHKNLIRKKYLEDKNL